VDVVITNDFTIDVKPWRSDPTAVMETSVVKVVHTSLDCSVLLAGKL